MDVGKMFLIILVIILVWMLCGFIGFLIEAKREGYTKFDYEERKEFIGCLFLGGITLIFMICCNVYDWFIRFMDSVLWRINHKK